MKMLRVTIAMCCFLFYGISVEGHEYLDIDAFFTLRENDKRLYLEDLLRSRRAKCQNYEFRGRTICYSVKFSGTDLEDGQFGMRLKELGEFPFQFFRHGTRYKSVLTMDYRKGQMDSQPKTITSVFDTETGIARSEATYASGLNQGSINSKEDNVLSYNHLAYWFYGGHDEPVKFPMMYLEENIDKSDFRREVDDSKQVVLRLPIIRELGNVSGEFGFREMWLDSRRGYMPTRILTQEIFGGEKRAQSLCIVNEFSEVDGIIYPSDFEERSISAVSIEENWATIYQTAVTFVSFGTVSEADIQFEFKDNSRIVDRTTGEWYDQSNEVRRPLGRVSSKLDYVPRAKQSLRRPVLLWSTAILLIVSVIITVRHRLNGRE